MATTKKCRSPPWSWGRRYRPRSYSGEVATADVVTVPTPDGEDVRLGVRPSGVPQWNYDAAGLPEGLVVLPLALVWNAAGRVAFRGGWTVWAFDSGTGVLARRRFRRKSEALAEFEKLAAALRAAGLDALRQHSR